MSNGPDQVELLFDGDRPQGRADRLRRPEDSVYPVAGEQKVAGNVVPGKMLIRHRMCEHDTQGNHKKVQRPDAQNTSDVEQPERNSTCLLPLPQQERRDQKSAQREKQIHACRTRLDDRPQQQRHGQMQPAIERPLRGQGMKDKDTQEGVEPQSVKLWLIEAALLMHPRQRNLAQHFSQLPHFANPSAERFAVCQELLENIFEPPGLLEPN